MELDAFHERLKKLDAKRLTLVALELRAERDAADNRRCEPIAIVGAGCRFPGGVETLDDYWDLLVNGRDAIRVVPADRWDVDALYGPDPDTPGTTTTRWGGFLDDYDPAAFDAGFFGISPREAASMGPQQRLLLEVTWEALESAGLTLAELAEAKGGVFMGIIGDEYAGFEARAGDPHRINVYSGTGVAPSVASGRLSHFLGMRGPNVVVDSACSSSLTAVHLACQSLRSGECNVVLAGGVNVILTPDGAVYFSRMRAMAPDGRCKAFDARADGFVRSEGCGVVVLKRVSDATRDGDRILAVVRGSAVNHDGRSSGLTVPHGPAQRAVIEDALASAGISPDVVGLLEAHGTGTALGDPIEFSALKAVFGGGRRTAEPLAISSVKTNLGHLEAAAGIAGLLKAALAVQHGVIPPHLHLSEVNEAIDLSALPAVIPTTVTAWPSSRRVAGISAFGINGSNAHVVLEQAPAANPEGTARITLAASAKPAHRPYVLPVSARSVQALSALAGRYAQTLRAREWDESELADFCYSASVRRSHHPHRLVAVGKDAAALAGAIEAHLTGQAHPGLAAGDAQARHSPAVAFAFPGQGSQCPGMGRELYAREPAYREAVRTCAAAMAPHVDPDDPWALLDVFEGEDDAWWLARIDAVQPALFAHQVGLAALWGSWGVRPQAVVGHSMGEVAAAHVAGALGLADAARVVCRRSRLLRRLSGQGAMLAVELPLDDAVAALRGMEDRVAVAVSNGPRSTVLSGERESLAAVLEAMDSRGVFGRWVQVDVASHSPQIDVLEEDLLLDLAELRPGTSEVPLYSTVTGRSIPGEALDAAYWFENVRSPVLFGAAATRLLEDGTTAFLELSPHPVLTLAAADAAREAQRDAVAVASQRRDAAQQETALIALGALFVHGYAVDWRRLYSSPRRVVSLPAYPWQRERFWTEVPAGARSVAERSHPLLARYLRSGVQPRTHHWEVDLSSQDFPFLQDHRVRNQALLPAAGYAEIALAAACALGMQSPALEEVTLDEALFVPDGVVTTVQVVMTVGAKDGVDVGVDGRASFEFVSMPNGREGATTVRRHARGYVRDVMDKSATRELGQSGEPPSAIQARCHQRVSNERHYAVMAERELSYGPAFRGVGELWRRDGESLARLTLPPQIAAEAHRYRVHPALLDACFQTLWAAVPSSDDRPVQENTFLNVGFEALRARTQPVMPPHGELWAHGTIAVDTGSTDTVIGDVRLLDGTGNVLMEARGVRHRRVGGASVTGDPVAGWFYGMEWHRTPPTRNAPDAATGTALVFGLGDGFSAAVIAELGQRGLAHVLVRPGSSFARPTPRQAVVRPGNREDIEALLRGVGNCRAVVHLWSAGEPPERDPSGLEAAQRVGAYSALAMAQALGAAADSGVGSVPRLWLVTSGVQVVDEGVAESAPTGDSDAVSAGLAGAPLWGLGRVIAHEFPALRRVNVDLAPNSAGEQAEMVGALCDELVAPESEDDEIALRHTGRYVARLARRSQSTLQSPSTFARIRRGDGSAGPVRLVTSAPGVLDRLEVEPAVRRAPGRGEVEIGVQRAALNFTDVMKALGVYPGARGEVWFGNECAGTVSAVGDGVSELAVGDRVVALAAGSLASHTVTRADLVARAPENLSAEEAATLPIAYVTAHYALCHLARLERGERVLIHAAAGGVGLAAVRIALHLGAEVYATAGKPEKRDHLRALGVQHVMDSRSLDFADEVKRLTDKRGVDVVLNSLAGEAIEKSLACLAPFGRFIELGKVDIYEERPLSLWPFHKNLTFSAVDLDAVGRERPELLAALLREVMELVALGAYVPLPHRVYALEDSVEAFRCMAQADHIGRILLAPPAGGAGGANDASAPRFSGDAAYLVVGGMGGLGLKVARWMVDEGARSLVLVGRGRPSDAAEVEMEALRARGADVRAVTADVADSDQVGELLVAIDRRGRPLKGIIHAAAVLDDGVLAHQTPERFEPVLAPKVTGAWNLHRLTLDRDLEFFVLFSSAASLVGSPGQGNYAAANAFLDALASFRRARNLPALAINWGPWAEVGLAAAQTNRGERLASEGAPNMAPPEALRALRAVMDPRYSGASQVGIMDMRWERWAANHPTVARSPLLAGLVRRGEGAPPANAVAPESRQESGSLVEYLRAQVGRVLRLDPARVSDTVPLIEYGLDSLMSIELRNRLEADLHVSVPLVRLLRGGTIEQLAAQLQDQPASPPGAPVPPAAPSASIVTNGHAPPRVNAPAAIGALAHHPNVVPLHVSGEGPAFFCVAPIMGVAFPYRTLARQVGEALSAPFLGLQPLGLEGEAPPSRSVEEMAECYVSAVRAVQPHGPYFLGGWSFGSMVAFELALQLSAAGEEVALLASIDSPAPGRRPSVLAAANFFVNTVGRGIWPYLGDYLALRGAAGSARASWRTVAEGAVLSSSLPREAQQLLAQSPAVRPMMDVYLASVRASWDYRPREWGGRVTLLRTERRSDRIRRDERSDLTWGWDKLARGGVDVVSIPGRHMLVLQEPHVDVLSARLVDCIRAAREAFCQDAPASVGAPGPGAGLEAVQPAESSHSMV